MKQFILILLSMILLTGCSKNKNEQTPTSDSPVIFENEVRSENFTLSEDQQKLISEMFVTSGIYKTYNKDYVNENGISFSIIDNYIMATAQSKEIPTLSIIRESTLQNGEVTSIYRYERFYRQEIEFEYMKADKKRNGILTVSNYREMDSGEFYHNQPVICELYVPSSPNQTNFTFYYDPDSLFIYNFNEQGEKEEYIFTYDLQRKQKEHCKSIYKIFSQTDDDALRLAHDIVEYINKNEN